MPRFVLSAVFAVVCSLLSGSAQAQYAGNMDDTWQSVLRRWVGNGWKPFHEGGYNFQAPSMDGRRFGAGLRAGEPVTFVAICGNCTTVRLIVRDASNTVLVDVTPRSGPSTASLTPRQTSAGSIQLIPIECRRDTCPVRYTSFTPR